jgi:hypothetical protein
VREPIIDEPIVSYVLGELDAEDAAACEARVAASNDLALIVERLRSLLAALRCDEAEPTPEAARRVRELWSQACSRPTLWERVVHLGYWLARPVFDGRAEPALAGYRNAAPTSYQLAYEGDAARVDLQVTSPEAHGVEAWEILGRVVAVRPDARPGRVGLWRTNRQESISETEADTRGRFSMSSAAGVYDLLIDLSGEGGLVVPDLEIG